MEKLNYTYIKDNILSVNKCEDIIEKFSNKLIKGRGDQEYSYYDFKPDECDFFNEINKTQKEYIQLYPELNYTTSIWQLTSLRLKHFKPGKCFNGWHSEHSIVYPNRILSMQIYLSDHNCGTLFFNDERILSKKGRVAIFPAFFTHTHKGEVCPNNKDRFIITGYYSFTEKGKLDE